MTEIAAPGRRRALPTPRAVGRTGASVAADGVRSALAPGAVAARAWVARIARPLRVGSALGWSVAGVAGLAAAAGLILGWSELVAIGAVGAAALLLAVPYVLGRMSYEVGVDLASSRVTAGDRASGRVRVRNGARRRAMSSRIRLPVGRAREEFRMPSLAPDETHEVLFTIPTARRAVLTVGPVTSVRSDPLALLRRELSWTRPSELYIHPRIVPLDSETVGLLRDLEGLPTRDLADDDISFHALREYAPGDDLRHVHWKSTARTQRLMIRQFEQTRRSHLVIALSTDADEYRDAAEFELAVSIAGSVGVGALRDGKTVSVVTSAGESAAGSRTRLLDALSGIELAATSRGGTDVAARAVGLKAPSASVVVFVTGAACALGVIRGAALRVPPTARPLCLRAVAAGELARRSIGDVVSADVPDLASLRAAMRAVAA